MPGTDPLGDLSVWEGQDPPGDQRFSEFLSAEHPSAFAAIQAYPGLMEILDTARELPDGTANVMFATRLEGIFLADGSQAYTKGVEVQFDIRQTKRGVSAFAVTSEDDRLLVSGEIGVASGRVHLLTALTQKREPELVSW